MTLSQFCAQIGQHGVPSDWVVADLSLGAWRTHQVALDFGGQLGVELPESPAAAPAIPVSGPSYAELVGQGIDGESNGDQSVIRAAQWAACVADAAAHDTVFVVVPPLFGLPFEPENEWFLRFLGRHLTSAGGRLVVLEHDGNGGQAVPRQRNPQPASLVPGTIGPDIRDVDLSGLLPLRNGRYLVPPGKRTTPVERFAFDRLAGRTTGWLRAYAQYYGNNLHVDPWFLCAEAWARFAEGGRGIALRLIDRAAPVPSEPVSRAIIQAQSQGMRIAAHRFQEVATGPEPSPSVPAHLKSFLLEAKGWGMTLVGDARGAAEYLERARQLMDAGDASRESLYLLNIAALCSLRSGDPDESLRIELEIEAGIERSAERDFRLSYVNSINTARLYRRKGSIGKASEYYERAFATTWGVRSQFDCVYVNASMARLERERDRPRDEFFAWLRAALHWAALEAPEAIGARAAGTLTGHNIPLGTENPDLAEEISVALADSLRRCAPAAGITAAPVDSEPPEFIRSGARGRFEYAFGAPGWNVLGASGRTGRPHGRPAHRRLRSLLAALLRSLGAGECATFGIDDRFGREMAVTREEFLATCLRLGIARAIWDGAVIDLGPEALQCLYAAARARLSPGVRTISTGEKRVAWVEFKRRLPRRALSAGESAVVLALGANPRLDELPAQSGDAFAILRELESAHIAEIYLPEMSYDVERMVPACV